ncbi:response regulator [Desulfobaculum sp. SPO524]|uniref:response regulator n=1 Tax=Desulfobaculum sp. SPO524 TaxID=3378071 RepID=UPI0038547C73
MRFLLVDDHAIVRKGIMDVASDYAEGIVFVEAGSSREAMEQVAREELDLVLLDISLPDESGLSTLKKIRRVRPELPVLVLSMHPEAEYAVMALQAGANGYIAKNSATDELVDAIGKVLTSGQYVSERFSVNLVREMAPRDSADPRTLLSERELQVLLHIAEGMRQTDIADKMGVSLKTVGTYKSRAMKKLGVKNNARLYEYLIKHSLISPF